LCCGRCWVFVLVFVCLVSSVPIKPLYTVTQSTDDVTVFEGMRVTLDCGYETTATLYLFWYKQYPNESPKYILRREKFGEGDTAPGYKERFDASLNTSAKTVPLTVQNVQLSDSAVYYCALRPTVRITFSHPLQKHLRY
uniref:Ig-like domain-containing protein n=1 Tax=Paramormyrops kingsleyae TaxID=1676925 RepID=A0A3B3Q635_9TELE